MSTPPDQYKKAPKRQTSRGKRVALSPEAKQAYEALIREADEREKMERHLPPDMRRR